MSLKRAVFLDRDGVINEDSEEFIKSPDELKILPGVKEALQLLQDAGFVLIIITNQSGIQRGILSEDDLTAIHQSLRERLDPVFISGIYHCPHGPDDSCDCRKPKPGMLLTAVQEHEIDLKASFLIGDRWSDISCGNIVEATTYLVLTGKNTEYDPLKFEVEPDFVSNNLKDATDSILSHL